MNKEKSTPIFYHPDDECDCVECDARRQPGGLDYDPSNDNEEFEKNEEEIMKEIEKGSIYKTKFKKEQTVKFKHISDFTGAEMVLTGIIKGFGAAVRKMWPIEMGEAPDDMLLVWRQDHLGQTFHYAVNSYDIMDLAIVKEG